MSPLGNSGQGHGLVRLSVTPVHQIHLTSHTPSHSKQRNKAFTLSLPQAPTAAFAIAVVLVVSVFTGAVIKVVVAVAATGAVRLGRTNIIVQAPIHHAVSTAIKFPSNRALGDTLAFAQGESAVALAVINAVVALTVRLALGVGRTKEIGVAPIVDAKATGVQFLAIGANRDTLFIFVHGPSLARFALVLGDQYLIGRTDAITLAGRASHGRNQITGARKAHGVLFAVDGQIRANVRAQISGTWRWGTGRLNGNVQRRAGRSQLGAASSRSGTRKVERSLAGDFVAIILVMTANPIQALAVDGIIGLTKNVVAASRVERVQ